MDAIPAIHAGRYKNIVMIIKFLKNHFYSLTILTFVITMLFGQLIYTFYQQDEWQGMGLVMSGDVKAMIGDIDNYLSFFLAKGRIFSIGIYYFTLYLFPLNNVPFAIMAISLHLIAASLVYILINGVLKSRTISLLGALFFAVNAVAQGSVTWSFVAIGTIGSTILILIALIAFFKYIESQKTKYLLLTTALLYISLFFKETGLYLFLFLPFASLIFKKIEPVRFIKKFWIMLFPFIIIVLFRVLELKFRTTSSNLYITGQDDAFFLTLLFRLIFYPLTSFSLQFIPGDQFMLFAQTITQQLYPFLALAPNNALITQTVVLDMLSIILSFAIIGLLITLIKKEKRNDKKYVVFWAFFSIASFFPYIVLRKDFSYMESRYYYLAVVGAAFLVGWTLKRLTRIFDLRFFVYILIPLYLGFLLWHSYVVYAKIQDQINLTKTRNDFVNELKKNIPTLPNNKNVFYIDGSNNYWSEGNKIPFQQGTGYTLMVLYHDSGKIPQSLLRDSYLFDISSQGYKEDGGYGFGYFWEENELNSAIKKHNISADSVIRLYYDSENKRLIKVN